jgi:hypothetical protein
MDVLKSDNYIENINSYTELDWKPLLDMIPEIDTTIVFGKMDEALDFEKTGVLHMSPYIKSDITMKFLGVVYDIPIVVDFNWGSWDEGRKIVSDKNFDFDTIDIPTKCKIITAIVRSDRFSDGVLIEAFESGMMLKVLLSIQKQLMKR